MKISLTFSDIDDKELSMLQIVMARLAEENLK